MATAHDVSFSRIIELSKQYNELDRMRNDLRGLYILPREKDIFTWDGILFVSSGAWSEGIFKFSLKICPQSNNGAIPVVTFVTPLYHPYINPRTNCLDVQYVYPQWRTDANPIAGLLLRIVEMFNLTSFDVNISPNCEAARFFATDTTDVQRKEIFKKIHDCVDKSIKTRNDPIAGSSLVFGKPTEGDSDEYKFVAQTLQVE
ncbi:hypothetical protein WA538_004953 [Blastocystis sp. DL]